MQTTAVHRTHGMPAVAHQPGIGQRVFAWAFPLLLAGFIFLDRGFAWLHVPGAPVFISETVLVFGVAGTLRALASPLPWRRSSTVFLLVVFAGWGMIRTTPGILSDPVVALRDAAIWLYILAVFAVLNVLVKRPHTLARWMRGYRRLVVPMVLWLPIAVFVSELFEGITVPDSSVSLFSYKPGNAAVHLLAGLAFLWTVGAHDSMRGGRSRTVVTVLGLVGILVLATQGRGGFVAVAVAGAVLLLLSQRRTRLVLTIAGSLIVIAFALVVVDPDISVGGRDISTEQFAENVTSIVSGGGEGELEGTIQWRIHHWGRVWRGTNADVPLIGHGFGVNLAEIYHIPQADIGLRNAHNSHLTVLARMGWVGAVIWVLAWVFWFWETARARRRLSFAGHGRLAGLASWAIVAVTAIHINAIFDPTLEGPQVALWLWSFCALGIYLVIMSRPGPAGASTGRVTTADLEEMLDPVSPTGSSKPAVEALRHGPVRRR
ncbi:MAG: O-antigen ligase family protein [Acidimicrobiia bacterium]